jgi:hypothetical protein
VKLGRNELCWCGSGIKYKKCHLNRDKQEPVKKSDVFKQLNSFYDNKSCSAPDSMKHECTETIIKAHSVSKSSSLKDIAKDGHVLTTFKGHKHSGNSLKLEPKKIGINQASTFTGFCSHHDNLLFSPIEDEDFTITESNCFLIAYRAIAREVFVKISVSSILDMMKTLDKGESLTSQLTIQSNHNHLNTNNDLTTGDLQHIKNIFDTCLEKQEFNLINHLIFTLDTAPKVMTSAIAGLTFDFQGEKIQSFSKDPKIIPDYLTINSFSNNGTGYIVLTWLETHRKSFIHFYKSLMKTASPSDSLTLFIFAMIENIYLSEEWWLNLNSSNKEVLTNAISQGVTSPTYNDVLITKNKFEALNIIKTTSVGFSHEAL